MNCLSGRSLDDDDTFSNISRISCGLQNSLNSIYNSDSESGGPVSVRDMIQHYNNQLKPMGSNNSNLRNTYKINSGKRSHHPSQHLLASTQSSYCGLNNYDSHILCCNRLKDHTVNVCCNNCPTISSCRNGSLKNSTTHKILSSTASSSSLLMLQPNENNPKPNNNFSIHNSKHCNCSCDKINAKDTKDILVVENCGKLKNETNVEAVGATISTDSNSNLLNDFRMEQSLDCSNGLFKNHNSQVVVEESSDIAEEANVCQQVQPPSETSYQSKTTIAKTSSGVRIIIDIFFDQEQCANVCDVMGSRVETDIPHSRILEEFQQQALAEKNNASSHSYQGL